MLKKSLYLGTAATLLMALCFGRNALSYVRTAVNRVSDTVKTSVPIGYEIDNARQMIQDLTPEIARNMRLIATEEVRVEELEKRVARADSDLALGRKEIKQLMAGLERGGDHCTFAGVTYSHTQVKADLASRFTYVKTADETAVNLNKVLSTRKRILESAHQKLNDMLAAKRQLEVEIENLEARMKMIEVAQTTSEFNIDDSHLARTKEIIRDIRTRLDVGAKLLNAETEFHDRIPLKLPENVDNIVEQVAAYFSENSADGIADHEKVEALVAENSRFSLN